MKLTVKILFIFFAFIYSFSSFAADISYDVRKDSIDFTLNCQGGCTGVDVLKSNKDVLLTFETSENTIFTENYFFSPPISKAEIVSDSFRKKLIISFEGKSIEPSVSKKGNSQVILSFPYTAPLFPPSNINTPIDTQPAKAPAVPGVGAYFRMIFGLFVVLFIVLIGYWFIKSYFKKKVFSDIPGSGVLVGKVDIDIRKSLFFYEIGKVLYVLGVTDSGINLIDKITDETEADKIRAGFTRKREFSGYLSFFRRKNALDDEMSVNNAIVEEKLKSLRKK